MMAAGTAGLAKLRVGESEARVGRTPAGPPNGALPAGGAVNVRPRMKIEARLAGSGLYRVAEPNCPAATKLAPPQRAFAGIQGRPDQAL
jgi:hypothetical protein